MHNCRNISTSQAYLLSGKILLEFIRALRKHVWKHRCMNMAEWERSHNITQADKRSATKSDPTCRLTRSRNTWNKDIQNAVLPYFNMMKKIIEVNAYASHVYPLVNSFNRLACFVNEDLGVRDLGLVIK